MTQILPHPSEDEIEAYSMGRLEEFCLKGFEMHLFTCQRCRDRVEGTDKFLKEFRIAVANLPRTGKGAENSQQKTIERERRREFRETCSDLVSVRTLLEAKSTTPSIGLAVDKSPSGLSIYINSPMEKGTKVVIRNAANHYRGVVRYCIPHGRAFYIGVDLSDETKAVLSKLAHSPNPP